MNKNVKVTFITLLVLLWCSFFRVFSVEAFSLLYPTHNSVVQSSKLEVKGRVEETGKVFVDIGFQGNFALILATKSVNLTTNQDYKIVFLSEELKFKNGEKHDLWLVTQFVPADKNKMPPFPIYLEFIWEVVPETNPAPAVLVALDPTSIIKGSSATLSWLSTNATSISVTPSISISTLPLSGSATVSPTTTSTYVFTATGPGGTVTASVTLTVTDPPPPPPPPQFRTVELRIGSTLYKVDGVTQTMDAAPYIEEGRTMVPVRFLAEGLGGTVGWDNATKTVTVRFSKPTIEIKLVIGNPIATVNGVKVPIDPTNSRVVPVLKNNRTFVPLRFLVEQITGSSIEWIPPDKVMMKLPR